MPQQLFRQRLAAEIEPISLAIMQALEQLPEPCRPVARHIIDAGGKRMRPFLTVLCARALACADDAIYHLAASMEMLHAATLLHDDVLDNAEKRRGHTAAHIVYGTHAAILAGDSLLAEGNAIVASFGKPALTACYSKATSQTAAGEILEMNSLGRPDLSNEEYMRIARGKTGCLIAQACAMGAIAAEASAEQVEACTIYGENLGIAFQIVDDALDFAPQSQTGKPCGGDLREGKMTPPLHLYRERLTPAARADFDRNFSAGSFSPEDLSRIVVEVEPFAAQAVNLAADCLNTAKKALNVLPSGEETLILCQMADYVRSRRS